MAQAPASNWRCDNSGDMVVLPCGASETPLSAQNRATTSMLCIRSLWEITITGNMKSSANRFSPASATESRSAAPGDSGQPLYCQPRSALARS